MGHHEAGAREPGIAAGAPLCQAGTPCGPVAFAGVQLQDATAAAPAAGVASGLRADGLFMRPVADACAECHVWAKDAAHILVRKAQYLPRP